MDVEAWEAFVQLLLQDWVGGGRGMEGLAILIKAPNQGGHDEERSMVAEVVWSAAGR